jgi:hypothetical protein
MSDVRDTMGPRPKLMKSGAHSGEKTSSHTHWRCTMPAARGGDGVQHGVEGRGPLSAARPCGPWSTVPAALTPPRLPPPQEADTLQASAAGLRQRVGLRQACTSPPRTLRRYARHEAGDEPARHREGQREAVLVGWQPRHDLAASGEKERGRRGRLCTGRECSRWRAARQSSARPPQLAPRRTLQPSGAARHLVRTPTACVTAWLSPLSRTKNRFPNLRVMRGNGSG